jgi:gliding motility-associated-like protein
MKKFYSITTGFLLLFAGLFFNSSSILAQVVAVPIAMPECTAGVPGYQIDLSNNPNDVFITPEVLRQPTCCGNGDRYLAFYVTLHPDVAMIEVVVAPGYADPGGSGNYQIVTGGDLIIPGTCGTEQDAGSPLCIVGSGPHKILYSKPGGNLVKYIFRQIPRPIYPLSQPTRLGCSLPLPIYGLNNINVAATSKSGNCLASLSTLTSYLSCTNCETPSFSAGAISNQTYPYTVTYTVTGTPKAAACGTFPTSGTFTVTVYDELTVDISAESLSYCESSSGTWLVADPNGGLAPYSYVWKNGSTIVPSPLGDSVLVNTPGGYTCTISDQLITETCDSVTSNTLAILEGNEPVITATTSTIDVCSNSPSVTISGTIQYATGGFWTGGDGTFNNPTTAFGSYANSPTPISAIYTPTAVDINNSSITLYLHSSGAAGGCTNDSVPIIVNFIDSIYANPTASTISCFGDSSLVTASGSGGVGAPFSYSWSTYPITTGPSTNAPAGTYLVTIEDSYGCTSTSSITISQPTQINLSLSSTIDNAGAPCDGTAAVIASGGTGPYTYLWSSGGITSTESNLCFGIDTVVVTDDNGCAMAGYVVVSNFTCQSFDIGITSHTDVSCYGGSDGDATASIVSGINTPFDFQWTNSLGQIVSSANNVAGPNTATTLPAGSYTVLVTDNLGCMDVAGVSITEPTPLNNTMSHVDVSFIGGNNGSATANPSGGTAGYTYSWSTAPIQTAQTATTLTSGVGGVMYYVDITDSELCTYEDSVLINQPPCNDFDLAVNTIDVLCNNQSNGQAYLVITNGTGPYSIVWSGGTPAIGNMSVTGLAANSYSVTVTDLSKNCTTFTTFSINEPGALSLALVPTNVTCFGDLNGTIDLTLTGGTYPFAYTWSVGGKVISSFEDLINLGPNTYTVTVTDANGCSATSSIGISQPAELLGTFTRTDNPCYGNTIGTSTATAVSGTGVFPYFYDWTGPFGYTASGASITNLPSGLYTYTITDLNGCTFQENVNINQPLLLTANATMTTQVTCAGGNDGAADLTVLGGIENYTYLWSNGSALQDPTNFTAGTFNVTVTDAHLCTATTSVTITTVADVTDPVITCTSNQAITSNTGVCTYTVSGTAWNATATDNCIVSSITYVLTGVTTGTGTTLNGVSFNLGLTTITWTATDGLGNTSTCSYTVTVTDDQNPTALNCAAIGNQTVTSDAGVCTYTHAGTAWNATASDNCSVASITYALTGVTTGTGTSLNGVVFNLGLTTVTWTATDGSGNSSTCSYTVTVTDNQNPTALNCAAIGNQTVTSNVGVCTYTVSGTAWNVTASDNCSVASITYVLTGVTTGSGTSLNGVVFNLGLTTVTWTATDGSGNISTCSYTVTVTDNQNPTALNCAAIGNQTVTSNVGVCTYTVSGTAWNVTASDNCSIASITYALTGVTTGTGTSLNGVVFNLGLTTVTWTATDGSGNSSTCSYTVTVTDNQNPTALNCAEIGNQTVTSNIGVCTYTHSGNLWNVTASDNCSIASITYVLSGVTTGTGASLNGVVFNLGITTVTWTATDGTGNTSTCSYTVTVTDNQNPTALNCAAIGNQTVTSDAGVCTYTHAGTAWNATASDNCSVASITYTLTGATTGTGTSLNGVVFNLGLTIVTWTATDGSGNSSTCSYTVTVTDNQNPTALNCAAIGNQTVTSNPGVCTYTVSGTAWNATASDNCSVASITYALTGATTGTGTSLNSVVFNLGLTTVTWTATDGSGNISTCSYTVTVTDNQLPAISSCGAAGNQTVNANTGICTYTHPNNTWNAIASDNCSVSTLTYNLTGVTTGSGTTLSGVVFNLGATTVTWTAIDGTGNATTCSFVVTVLDIQSPIISSCGVSGNQTINVDAGQCNYTQTGTGWNALVSDNCSIASLNYTLTGATTGSGTSLVGVDFNLGTTTVLWTATDGSGNISTCTFTVLVVDNLLPTITSCGAIGNQTVNSNSGVCTYTQVTNAWNATATDNCTVSTLTYNLTGATTGTGATLNGVVFNPGTTTVTWTAVDNSSNSSSCTFNVIVTDVQVPIISGCPTNITIGSDNGDCGAIVTWTAPTFIDNCGASMTSNHNSGEFFPIGTTTITYTVVDGSGNTTICTFSVTVNDDENPAMTCASPIATCNTLVTYAATSATDNCGILSTIQTSGLPSGSIFPVGTTTNSFQSTDIHGNISTCSFNVTIYPTPVASTTATDVSCFSAADGIVDLTVTTGTAPYDFAWSNSVTSEDVTGLAPGLYSVLVTDDNGCVTTASASITQPDLLVLTAENDQVNCYNGNDGGIDITIVGGTTPYLFDWNNGETSEDIISLITGNYDVTVTDFNGCQILYNTTIEQPDTLAITAEIFDAQCDSPTGSIISEVTGGTYPYSFDWSNGATVMSLYNVVAGTYTLTVTDLQNCVTTFAGTINSNLGLTASVLTQDVKCYGGYDGEIQAIIESGAAPFTYAWSDGQSTPTATDLSADSYSVIITDLYGCQVTLNADINQPDSLYATYLSSVYAGDYNVSTNNGQDGSINVEVFGGILPYSYDWTGPSNFTSQNQDIDNLEAGAYSLTILDGYGCLFSISTRISEPRILEMPSGISPNGDGSNETFVVHGIEAYPENEITIYNRWGNIVYKKSNYANEWAGDNMNGEQLPDATYFVILTVFATENITLKGYVDLRR